jgi:two-component system, NarL family, sensor histidine kinase UhpB
MSLRLRLLVSIGLALLASLAFGGALTFWHAARQVQTEMQAAIAVGAHVAQNAIDDSKQPGADRRQRLERLITEFDGDRHLQASLVDRDGRILLTSKPESPNDPVPGWFHRVLGGESQVMQVKLPTGFEEYGGVVFTTDPSNELAEAWSDIGLAFAVLATFCTLVLVLVYLTLARGLRPLRDLIAAFVRVGRGDYGPRLAESGPTELARLAREFNQMVARLNAMKLQNNRLNEQLTNVQEEERADLARELHDEIGPFLFSVGLDVSTIHQIMNSDPALHLALAPRLEAIRDAVFHMQKHLKLILGRLRPAVLLDLGLSQAVDSIVDFWRGRHPDVSFDVEVSRESFGEPIDSGIYRIVRESLSNALRHGHPSRIEIIIRMEAEDTIGVGVIDDGGGMMAAAVPAVGFGIIGMQERAAMLGGVLTVRNSAGDKGVIVSASLPLHAAPAISADATEAISA